MLATAVFLAFLAWAPAQWRHFGEDPSTEGSVPSRSTAAQMLQAHNAIRTRIGVPSLVWSAKLASYAEDWAHQLAREGRLRHHSHPVYGENLYLIEGGRVAPETVVGSWAAERSNYNYNTNSCRGRCGHFTQIVWRTTRQVGCAQAQQGSVQVWVCEYDPPGNFVGERPY
jgi:uncharacterized protein YkwD